MSCGTSVTTGHYTRYFGQPTQYRVGCGSQLSVLVVFDHGRKAPGRRRQLHRLAAAAPARSPRSTVPIGSRVLIINTNLPIPSAWSRRRIEVESDRQELLERADLLACPAPGPDAQQRTDENNARDQRTSAPAAGARCPDEP